MLGVNCQVFGIRRLTGKQGLGVHSCLLCRSVQQRSDSSSVLPPSRPAVEPTAFCCLAAGGSYCGQVRSEREAGARPTLRKCGALCYCLYTSSWHNA